jgi:hypothetical protein
MQRFQSFRSEAIDRRSGRWLSPPVACKRLEDNRDSVRGREGLQTPNPEKLAIKAEATLAVYGCRTPATIRAPGLGNVTQRGNSSL